MTRSSGQLIVAATALLALSVAMAAPPAAPVRDYRFQGSLKEDSGNGPGLGTLGGKLVDGAYAFLGGEGLRLDNVGVKDHYSLELEFLFDDVDGWQKVIDFHDRASDRGVYVYNGQAQFYNVAIGGEFDVAQKYVLRLDRDRETKTVRAFLNGKKLWEFEDRDGAAIFIKGIAYFFVDDFGTGSEHSGGEVTRLRIWTAPRAE